MTGHQQAQQLKKQAGQSSKNHLASKTVKQKDQLPAAGVRQASQQSQGQHVQSIQVDVDELAREKVQEIEQSLEKATGSSLKLEAFTNWFSVLKQIITAADLHRTNDKDGKSSNEGRDNKHETGDSIYADFADDNEQFNAHVDLSEQFATNNVKWTIRVKAFKIVHRLVQLVLTGSNNVTSALPNRLNPTTPTISCSPPKILIKHLPDLVRLSFVAATSPYDELKMQGLEMFRVLIEMFASHEEPEFPGHSILEQYKTQVLSAVKPAFNLDAPPYITAIASQICSLWICQGLEKSSSDVKRTYQLMLLSIEKLEGQSVNQHSKLYTESELEQERVDILGSWAHLYIASEESRFSEHHGRISRLTPSESEHLNGLVVAQVETLVDKWWEALKDYALLIMPSPKFIGTSHDNGNVYTREVALRLFSTTWPKLVLALTIWLCSKDDPSSSIPSDNTTTDPTTSSTNSLDCDKLSPRSYQKRVSKIKYCKFLCGIIMKELSRCIVNNKRESRSRHLTNSSVLTLRSIHLILSNKQCQQVYLDDLSLAQEFYRALYHITVMFGRDPSRSLLRETLDLMFSLIAKRISDQKENIHYGIAKIISCLMSSMKDIEIAYGEKSLLDIELNRLHLFVRLHNLMTLIGLAPIHAMSELQLQEALIAVFQEMLRFDKDPTVGITLADQLRDLYPHIEANTKNHFIDELFLDFCRRVEELLEQLFSSDKYCDSDKVNLSRANTLLRTMRVMIDQLNKADSKMEKIQAYIQTLLKKEFNIPDEKLEELISAEAKKKRELIDFCLSQISTLKESCPDHFGDKLDPEIRRQFDTAFSLQHKIKSKIDSKNKEMQKSRKQAASSSQKPQVAKIALKADFSNFYAKKT